MISSTGPSRKLTLRNALLMILGHRPVWMSKRLGPPMGIANAGIWLEQELIWEGDLDFIAHYRQLARAAEYFGVVLAVKRESGTFVWSSNQEDVWRDYAYGVQEPALIRAVFPHYKKAAEEQQKQWMIDHGLDKRRRTQCPKSKSSKTLKSRSRPASSRRASSKSAKA